MRDSIGGYLSSEENLARRLVDNPPQTLYTIRDDKDELVGILKCGPKHLCYWKQDGTMLELDVLCVLDFFVSRQRLGIGRRLFDHMLRDQNCHPARLAYDRPSIKMFPFLSKHYSLVNYVPQPYNVVIFDDYFNTYEGVSQQQERRKA